MSGSSREAHPNVRKWSGSPPGNLGVVERPFWMSGSCWEALQMSRSGPEALPNVWEWTGDPAECLGVVGGPPRCPGVFGRPT